MRWGLWGGGVVEWGVVEWSVVGWRLWSGGCGVEMKVISPDTRQKNMVHFLCLTFLTF